MEKLYDILKNIKPGVDFKNEKQLVESGILDSLDIVEIVTTVENMYGIEIDPIQIDPDNFESVETIWKMIQSIKEGKI